MKQGNFDETDMKNAKQLIVASFRSMEDEQDSTISYYFGKEKYYDIWVQTDGYGPQYVYRVSRSEAKMETCETLAPKVSSTVMAIE